MSNGYASSFNQTYIIKRFSRYYPLIVGLLLGMLQTGLFFQLTFTLSSTFGTFLLVTLSWLLGSATGVLYLKRLAAGLRTFLAVALVAYAACGGLLSLFPFATGLWPLYAALIFMTGFYPGVFFARMSQHYTAKTLFTWENNGFIVGLILATIAFMLAGRIVLWILPFATAVIAAALAGGDEYASVEN